ncbi:hypothetical protein CHS0354_036973 [Potamilus streckersoni]|uniref:Uncharacterized protein n=1 Tax=Potamilus streckersoni TaxID=2493646 RepID=A0AAE0TBG6_9BIVA|nr:hypothetical protein CHS0354_036973 [Potamilus streckersoni]
MKRKKKRKTKLQVNKILNQSMEYDNNLGVLEEDASEEIEVEDKHGDNTVADIHTRAVYIIRYAAMKI